MSTQEKDNLTCPSCNSSWLDPQHPGYFRYIGIEVQGVYDGIIAIRCPDCGECFPRPDVSLAWAGELFERYLKACKEVT